MRMVVNEIIDLGERIRFNPFEVTKKKYQKGPVSFKNKKQRRSFSGARWKRRLHGDIENKASIEKKYFHSLEQYWSARKKYFEFFHRARGKKLDKLKRNFYRSLEELRRLEKGLKRESNGEDLTYSCNHHLDPHPNQENFETGESEEFYLLESQKINDYSNDTEESVGTMEDYLSYKGRG